MWIVDRHFPKMYPPREPLYPLIGGGAFKLDRGEVKQLNVSLTGCVGVEGLERSKLQEIRFTSNVRTTFHFSRLLKFMDTERRYLQELPKNEPNKTSVL